MSRAVKLAVLASLLAACGLVQHADPRYEMSATARGGIVTLNGRTTLPDGSAISIWATHLREGTLLELGVGDPQQVTVDGGSFTAELDLAHWPAGQVIVNALFLAAKDQPAQFYQRYGPDGSLMVGAAVRHSEDDGWALQGWTTVRIDP